MNTPHHDPLTDDHGALTFHSLPDAGIGDITSTAKGSGARYNTGKAPYELVPLTLLAEHYARQICYTDHASIATLALRHMGSWQSRSAADGLQRAMASLGAGGWEECARVFDYGRIKYSEWNWAKGMRWSVPLACAARHLLAMINGDETDPESGLPHRGHVYCNITMLLTFEKTYPEGDDRPAAGLLP